MRKIILFFILTIFVLSCKNEKTEYDEISIYNELLDSLYNIEYCHIPMLPPNHNPDFVDTNSTRYKNYSLRFKNKMNEFYAELDTLNLIVFTKDSFSELNLELDKDFILQNLGESDSSFIQLVNSGKVIPTKKLNLTSLKQKNILFSNRNELDSTFRCEYGINNNDFLIGTITLSRILLDEKQKIGILKFGYFGGCQCGYGNYIFIQKNENNKWIIIKTLGNWIS